MEVDHNSILSSSSSPLSSSALTSPVNLKSATPSSPSTLSLRYPRQHLVLQFPLASPPPSPSPSLCIPSCTVVSSSSCPSSAISTSVRRSLDSSLDAIRSHLSNEACTAPVSPSPNFHPSSFPFASSSSSSSFCSTSNSSFSLCSSGLLSVSSALSFASSSSSLSLSCAPVSCAPVSTLTSSHSSPSLCDSFELDHLPSFSMGQTRSGSPSETSTSGSSSSSSSSSTSSSSSLSSFSSSSSSFSSSRPSHRFFIKDVMVKTFFNPCSSSFSSSSCFSSPPRHRSKSNSPTRRRCSTSALKGLPQTIRKWNCPPGSYPRQNERRGAVIYHDQSALQIAMAKTRQKKLFQKNQQFGRATEEFIKRNPHLAHAVDSEIESLTFEPNHQHASVLSSASSSPSASAIAACPFTRLLLPTSPCAAYRERKQQVRSNIPWAQRRRLLLEIEFLSSCTSECDGPLIVVYAGAAPGGHLSFLADLFPFITFHCIDPAPFHCETRSNVHILRELFSDRLAAEYSKDREKVLFICDIRTSEMGKQQRQETTKRQPRSDEDDDTDDDQDDDEEEEDEESEIEANLIADLESQLRWYQLLQPRKALLKFRLPSTSGSTRYLSGDIYFPVWGSNLTTETRLVPTSPTQFTVYHHTTIQQQMVAFHERNRIQVYQHGCNLEGSGLDSCYDCAAEVSIWKNYVEKNSKIVKQILEKSGKPDMLDIFNEWIQINTNTKENDFNGNNRLVHQSSVISGFGVANTRLNTTGSTNNLIHYSSFPTASPLLVVTEAARSDKELVEATLPLSIQSLSIHSNNENQHNQPATSLASSVSASSFDLPSSPLTRAECLLNRIVGFLSQVSSSELGEGRSLSDSNSNSVPAPAVQLVGRIGYVSGSRGSVSGLNGQPIGAVFGSSNLAAFRNRYRFRQGRGGGSRGRGMETGRTNA